MPVTLTCARGARIRLRAASPGRAVKCPKCGAVLRVTAGDVADGAAPENAASESVRSSAFDADMPMAPPVDALARQHRAASAAAISPRTMVLALGGGVGLVAIAILAFVFFSSRSGSSANPPVDDSAVGAGTDSSPGIVPTPASDADTNAADTDPLAATSSPVASPAPSLVAGSPQGFVGRAVAWQGQLKRIESRGSKEVHLVINLIDPAKPGITMEFVAMDDSQFEESIADYRADSDSGDRKGNLVDVTGVVGSPDDYYDFRILRKSGAIVYLETMQRGGEPDSRVVVGQARDPATITAAAVIQRDQYVYHLRHQPTIGAEISFKAVYNGYNAGSVSIDAPQAEGKPNRLTMWLASDLEKSFADYMDGCDVLVTARLAGVRDDGDFVLEGRSVRRPTNKLSEVTPAGRTAMPPDWAAEHEKWRNLKVAQIDDDNAVFEMSGYYLGAFWIEDTPYVIVVIQYPFYKQVPEFAIFWAKPASAARRKTLLEDIKDGTEIIAEVQARKAPPETKKSSRRPTLYLRRLRLAESGPGEWIEPNE